MTSGTTRVPDRKPCDDFARKVDHQYDSRQTGMQPDAPDALAGWLPVHAAGTFS